jgi:hypothetical protein
LYTIQLGKSSANKASRPVILFFSFLLYFFFISSSFLLPFFFISSSHIATIVLICKTLFQQLVPLREASLGLPV